MTCQNIYLEIESVEKWKTGISSLMFSVRVDIRVSGWESSGSRGHQIAGKYGTRVRNTGNLLLIYPHSLVCEREMKRQLPVYRTLLKTR